jgi:hypothetical protein
MVTADKEHVMDRNIEQRDENLIDLGAASVETKGPIGDPVDELGGNTLGGISAD